METSTKRRKADMRIVYEPVDVVDIQTAEASVTNIIESLSASELSIMTRRLK
jgi:hypothetical protein